MSVFQLLESIRDALAPKLAQMPMAVRSRKGLPPDADEPEPMRPCAILLGSMPPTSPEAQSKAPFLVIQPMDGEDTPDGLQTVRVVLRLCIVGDDCEAAENDLLNLLALARLALLELPGGVIGSFRLLPAGESGSRLPWERPDEQVPPFLQAHIFSQWQTAGAAKKPNLKMVDYE